MISRRIIKKQNIVKDNNYNNLSFSDVLCPICRTILIEPVTLPCNHGFCSACFDGTMANTNLVCPLCRIRVGSWLRSSKKENKFVNVNLWEAIQKHFPQHIKNKLEGIDENVEEEAPIRITSKPGEIRHEYEIQRAKEEEEIRRQHEEEEKASQMLIRKLKEAEELENSIIEEKLKVDEQVAKKLAEELSFDPGPSTSKIETEKIIPKKKGPLDTFLENMANKQLSVSLKPVNQKKKEFTSKVLFQDKCGNLAKNNSSSITISKLNSVINERQSVDSDDTVVSEYRYFKPIEHKKVPPSKMFEMLRVPAIFASPVAVILRPPCGNIEFKHHALESPFVRLQISPTLFISNEQSKKENNKVDLVPSSFNKRSRSNNARFNYCKESQENDKDSDDEECSHVDKKVRVTSTSRQTRSMTKTSKSPEKRIKNVKDIKRTLRKRSGIENVKEQDNINNKSALDIMNGDCGRSACSPFLGFEKNYTFSFKCKNGLKNLNAIFDEINDQVKQKDNSSKKIVENEFDEVRVEKEDSYPRKSNGECPKSERNNGLPLNGIELVIGAKCLRSVSNKRKVQEEEDLKLAQKLHEELNCVKYPTRNSISHVTKKFPASRRQITLYKFLEK